MPEITCDICASIVGQGEKVGKNYLCSRCNDKRMLKLSFEAGKSYNPVYLLDGEIDEIVDAAWNKTAGADCIIFSKRVEASIKRLKNKKKNVFENM